MGINLSSQCEGTTSETAERVYAFERGRLYPPTNVRIRGEDNISAAFIFMRTLNVVCRLSLSDIRSSADCSRRKNGTDLLMRT